MTKKGTEVTPADEVYELKWGDTVIQTSDKSKLDRLVDLVANVGLDQAIAAIEFGKAYGNGIKDSRVESKIDGIVDKVEDINIKLKYLDDKISIDSNNSEAAIAMRDAIQKLVYDAFDEYFDDEIENFEAPEKGEECKPNGEMHEAYFTGRTDLKKIIKIDQDMLDIMADMADEIHKVKKRVKKLTNASIRLSERLKMVMNHNALTEAQREFTQKTLASKFSPKAAETKDDDKIEVNLRSDAGTEEAFYNTIAKPIFEMAKYVMEIVTNNDTDDAEASDQNQAEEKVEETPECGDTEKKEECSCNEQEIDPSIKAFYDFLFGGKKKSKKKKKKCKNCTFKDECEALKKKARDLIEDREDSEIKIKEVKNFDIGYVMDQIKKMANGQGAAMYIPGVGMVGYAMMKDRNEDSDNKTDEKTADDKEAEKCAGMFDCSTCHQDKCKKCPDNKEDENGGETQS